MICKNCGKEVKDNAKFCMSCGAQIESSSVVETSGEEGAKKKKTPKWILVVAIIVGAIIGIISGMSEDENVTEVKNITVVESNSGYGASFSCDLEEFIEVFNANIDKHLLQEDMSDEEYETVKNNIKLSPSYFSKDEELYSAYNESIGGKFSVALDENGNVYMARYIASGNEQTNLWIDKMIMMTLNSDLDEDEVGELLNKCITNMGLEEDDRTYAFMSQGDEYTLVIFAGIA